MWGLRKRYGASLTRAITTVTLGLHVSTTQTARGDLTRQLSARKYSD
jgi:hypothetical protein